MLPQAFTVVLTLLAAYLMATGVFRLAYATAPPALRLRNPESESDELAHVGRTIFGMLLLVLAVGVHAVTGGDMLLRALEVLPTLLGAYLTATGVFQLALAPVSTAGKKIYALSGSPLVVIGGIIWTMCVLVAVGFHFGSGGTIPLQPIFILTLVFVHCDAILICLNVPTTKVAVGALLWGLLSLVGLAAHIGTDVWILRALALTFTLLAALMAAAAVIKLACGAASSTLRRSNAGVDAVSLVLAHVCDALLAALFMSVALWMYCGTDDRESREFTLTSTAILIAICLMDMCIFQLTWMDAPALVHGYRALSGALLTFIGCITTAKHMEQYPLAHYV